MKWIWTELTRPRGSQTNRFFRGGRGSRSGVAIIMVLGCFLFLTMTATELTTTSMTRVQLAANLRDEAKAEALARSGLNFYRLILIAANGLDSKVQGMNAMFPQLSQMGISGDMLWQMVPMINTNLLRMVFATGEELDAEEQAEFLEQGGLTQEQREESEDMGGSKPGFLSFNGDFLAEVTDETRRINIRTIAGQDIVSLQNDPAGSKLFALMTGNNTCEAIRNNRPMSADDLDDRNRWFIDRDLEPLELIGNLADWVDRDGNRAYQGGNEDSLYENLDDPYRTKNAPFDSLQEVRLVDGWHRDDVWEKFGEQVTVFGDGKVNVNTADCEVLFALIRTHVQPMPPDMLVDSCVRAIEGYRLMVPFGSPQAFANFLENGTPPPMPQSASMSAAQMPQGTCNFRNIDKAALQRSVSTKTKVFRVTSTGTVGQATVKIEAVFDFSSNAIGGKTLYWRIE